MYEKTAQNIIDLIVYKTFADLKAETERAYLGFLWWIIEPVLYMGVFYLVFTVIRYRHGEGFVPFLLVGLIPWKWFANTISNGSRSIINNVGLMDHVYVPKYVFPCVVLLVNFFKFTIVMCLMIGFLLVYGIPVGLPWVALPVVILVQFVMTLAVTGLLSAVTPFIPDLRQVIDNAMMLLFFLSGVMFDINQAPEKLKMFLYVNPMVALIDAYRSVLVEGKWPHWGALLVLFCVSVVFLILAKKVLDRYDRIYPKLIVR